jgi:hypothetical protein
MVVSLHGIGLSHAMREYYLHLLRRSVAILFHTIEAVVNECCTRVEESR